MSAKGYMTHSLGKYYYWIRKQDCTKHSEEGCYQKKEELINEGNIWVSDSE